MPQLYLQYYRKAYKMQMEASSEYSTAFVPEQPTFTQPMLPDSWRTCAVTKYDGTVAPLALHYSAAMISRLPAPNERAFYRGAWLPLHRQYSGRKMHQWQ